MHEFINYSILQANFAPVEELGEAMDITDIEGHIPHHFPEGVYVRNGIYIYYLLVINSDFITLKLFIVIIVLMVNL